MDHKHEIVCLVPGVIKLINRRVKRFVNNHYISKYKIFSITLESSIEKKGILFSVIHGLNEVKLVYQELDSYEFRILLINLCALIYIYIFKDKERTEK